MGDPRTLVRALVPIALLASCGGSPKKATKKPIAKTTGKTTASPPESEADREKKRHDQAVKIVPEGSACLPGELKDDGAPRLELAAIGTDAILCAVDTNTSRLLGPVACWKVDLANGALAYQDPAPLPGRGFDVLLDDRCARGYCLPKETKLGSSKVGHIAWNLDGTKVAVLVGDDIHIFDAASKAHESTFNVRGDKGVTNEPTAIHFVGDALFVEGADQGPYAAVWMYKTDGSQVGPILGLGGKEEKPISTFKGSFSILDKNRIGLSERGMEQLTTYEIESGKRAKLVRKVAKFACKADELDGYWHDGDKVTDKCRDSVLKTSGYLMGATVIAGSKNFLVLLRNERLGELGVLDAKSLAEKKAIKLAWCGKDSGGDKADKKADKADKKADDEDKGEKKADKPGAPKKGAKAKSSDPDEGGE